MTLWNIICDLWNILVIIVLLGVIIFCIGIIIAMIFYGYNEIRGIFKKGK